MATYNIGSGQTYTTIQAFINDASTLGADPVGEIQDNAAFNEVLSMSSVSAWSGTLTLTAASGVRHDGTPGSGARIVSAGTGSTGRSGSTLLIEWLEFDFTGRDADGDAMNITGGSNVTIRNTLMHSVTRTAGTQEVAMIITAGSSTELTLQNCAIFDIKHTGSGDAVGVRVSSSDTTVIENCTITDIDTDNSGDDGRGLVMNDNANHTYRNNLVTNITNSGGGSSECYSLTSVTNATATTNGSDDATSPNSALRNLTVAFEDSASQDYRLAAADTDAIDAGTDLGSGAVAVDMLGRNRDTEGDTWDLGAFEYVSAGGATLAPLGGIAGDGGLAGPGGIAGPGGGIIG